MNRYFLVLIARDGLDSDFRVGEFPNPEKAFQLADVVASELSLDPYHRWAGGTLEVRDVHGQLLVAKRISVSKSIPVSKSVQVAELAGAT